MIRTILTILPIFILVTAFSGQQQEPGKALYEHHCARCHGAAGNKGMFGAKDLQRSLLPDTAIALQIQNGKRIMPSFRKKFTSGEITAVAAYIKSFRKS